MVVTRVVGSDLVRLTTILVLSLPSACLVSGKSLTARRGTACELDLGPCDQIVRNCPSCPDVIFHFVITKAGGSNYIIIVHMNTACRRTIPSPCANALTCPIERVRRRAFPAKRYREAKADPG